MNLTLEQIAALVKFYDWLDEECAIRDGIFLNALEAISFYDANLSRATGDTPR